MWFARIEEACAAFIERAFANMFPSDLEPAQIARKLVATMEARSHSADARISAPDRYAVYVNGADFVRLSPHRAYLEGEWGALLDDVARRAGIALAGKPHVELRKGAWIVAGAMEIEAGDEELPAATSAPRAYALQMIGGMGQPTAFRVSGAARVGRSAESDVALTDPSVSRNHALLDVRNGTLVVRDAGSTNGTYVNGRRIETAELQPGDTVGFGKTELRVDVLA